MSGRHDDGDGAAAHEVWARTAMVVFEVVKAAGHEPGSLGADLAADEAAVRRRLMVGWDVFTALVGRAERSLTDAGVGHDELIERCMSTIPELRGLPSGRGQPGAFLRLLVETVLSMLLPPLQLRCVAVTSTEARVEVVPRPGVTSSPALLRVMPGVLGALMAAGGVPVRVASQPNGAGVCYVVTWEAGAAMTSSPPVQGGHELRFTVGWTGGDTPIATTLRLDPRAAHDGHVRQMAERWRLTPKQREVLGHLVGGASNKEIAAALGCAENTVELHVTQLLRKASATSRKQLIGSFWREARGQEG